jgi:hypothetical protein
VVNQQQTKWEQALPQETAAALAQSRSGNQDSNILGDIVQGVQDAFQQGGQVERLLMWLLPTVVPSTLCRSCNHADLDSAGLQYETACHANQRSRLLVHML